MGPPWLKPLGADIDEGSQGKMLLLRWNIKEESPPRGEYRAKIDMGENAYEREEGEVGNKTRKVYSVWLW